ncbi:MAG TPA: RcnB family protein, partial [Caulobacter sp.]|nr:RcnB family protein [Caulobacter sp.]
DRGDRNGGWDRGPGRGDQGRPDYGRPGQNGHWRDRDNDRQRYDQRRYQPSYRATQRYRVPAYRYPRGFYARRWAFGDYLPGGWYGSPYYLDAWRYGLPYPPIGCEWVRVGDDAVLVDVWSGQVLSVYYDLFW